MVWTMSGGKEGLHSDEPVPLYLVVGGFAAYASVVLSIVIFRSDTGFGSSIVTASSLFLLLIGLGLSVLSRITLGRAYHFMPRSKRLVTHGIYNRCRHPMYVGNQLFFIGVSLYLGSDVGLVLSVVVLLPTHVVRARYEEKVLTDRFKSEYTEYRRRTVL